MSIFMKLLEKEHYRPDGSVTPEFRKYLEETGTSDEEIALYEKLQREENESDRLFAPLPENRKSSLKDRAIARQGLDTEELLSQGYLNIDELDEIDDIDSFDIEDLL